MMKIGWRKNFNERIDKEKEKERKKKIEEYMEKLVSQTRRVAKNQIWNHVIFSLRHHRRMITTKGRLTFGKIITQARITS